MRNNLRSGPKSNQAPAEDHPMEERKTPIKAKEPAEFMLSQDSIKAFALEAGPYNINVNSVCYGLVETAMTEAIREEKFRQRYLDAIPLGRFSSSEEVAPATCFFLSDAASYITGQHIAIDGGFHITA